jgi:preprotein translocase subunit SecA
MALLTILEKVFKKKSERDYLRLRPVLEEIKRLRAPMAEWRDERLKGQTARFKERLAQGEMLDDLLPEAYATVWETCRRLVERKADWQVFGREQAWDMVPYDVQIIGAIALHEGKIAEMATGEGKTLVATFPLYLNSLEGKGAHLVTVNDYLAQRDAEWMGGIYAFLGASCRYIKNDMTPAQRREAYAADITYGTNNEFGFDYLRDNMAVRAEDLVQRAFHFAIVDEVDSVLVDEARTPLIISGPVGESTHRFGELKPFVEGLVRKQTRLLNSYLDEIEAAFGSGGGKIDDDTALKLLRVSRGGPKLGRFMKLCKTAGAIDAIRRAESSYMMEKALWEVDADLFYVIEEKQHSVDLSDKGREEFGHRDPDFFVLPDLAVELGQIESDPGLADTEKARRVEALHRLYAERNEGIHNVQQLLKAYTLYNKDDEYVVQDGRILIVDEFTGRLMPGRRFSEGLHSALEAKEGVQIEAETQTYATITLQNLFRMYGRLAGMTGTAETEAGEFHEIYKLDVVVIPTNVPARRDDDQDQIYRTKREKYAAIIEEIDRLHRKGLPVLIGTTTVEVSETLSRLLKRRGIRHNVLNARHHQREAEIVAAAGQLAALTIATNMAGRGTDIKLGPGVRAESGAVEGDPAGLHIVGSERHESRRIDRQLRGRSGRQGDPGRTIFYLSLEDDLMRLFGSDRIARLMDRIGLEEGEVITHPMVTKAIEKAQMRVEQHNFSIRKRLLDYDDVMNKQREVVYAWRKEALLQEDISASTLQLIEDTVDDLLEARCDRGQPADDWDWPGLSLDVTTTFLVPLPVPEAQRKTTGLDGLREALREAAVNAYRAKEQRLSPQITRQLERHVTLRTIDELWKDHLYELDILRSGIGLRAYGQKDPLLEYKSESFNLFQQMMVRARRETVTRFFRYELVAAPPRPAAPLAGGVARKADAASAFAGAAAAATAMAASQATAIGASPGASAAARAFQTQAPTASPPPAAEPVVRAGPKVGRNDPCPCGSGKKFKKCHGQE